MSNLSKLFYIKFIHNHRTFNNDSFASPKSILVLPLKNSGFLRPNTPVHGVLTGLSGCDIHPIQ